MLRFTEAAVVAIRQGQKRFSRSEAVFGVYELEPRVLLTASGADWTEPTADSGPLVVEEEPSGSEQTMAFSMAWDEPVAAPSDLSATALSSTEIRLSWSDNSHNETGFGIWKWVGTRLRMITTVGANVTEYVDAGLTPATTYLYQVHAFNDFSSSALSETATGTTVPLAPTNLMAAAVSSSEIELTWTGSSGASGYHIERSLDGITGWMLAGTTDSFTWDMTDSGLDAGTTYHYRVMAVNAGGLSAPSLAAAATTEQAPIEGPAAPSSVAASVFGHKHVQLSWDSAEDAAAYVIERSDNGGDWMEIAVVEACMTDYNDHRVSLNGTHAYRVRTVSDVGISRPSDEPVVTIRHPSQMARAASARAFSVELISTLADDHEPAIGLALAKGKIKK